MSPIAPNLLRSTTTGASVLATLEGLETDTWKLACAWADRTISETSAIIICFFFIDFFKFV